jgi:Domain of unknown function (DUF4124)
MTNIYCQPSHAARVALIALMFAMGCGLARASEVNMWFDETGEVHYSDRPPAGVKARRTPRSDPSIIAGTTAADSTPDAEPAPVEDQQGEASAQADSERRHKMIEDCEQNNGVDCERQVDTELGAEAIQRGGHVIHQMTQVGTPKH